MATSFIRHPSFLQYDHNKLSPSFLTFIGPFFVDRSQAYAVPDPNHIPFGLTFASIYVDNVLKQAPFPAPGIWNKTLVF